VREHGFYWLTSKYQKDWYGQVRGPTIAEWADDEWHLIGTDISVLDDELMELGWVIGEMVSPPNEVVTNSLDTESKNVQRGDDGRIAPN